MRSSFAPKIACSVALLLAASAAFAARTQTWSTSSQKEFAEGTFDNTIVDSYGQLSLGRALDHVKLADPAEVVAGFVQTSDSFYVAASPEGKIYAIDGTSTKPIFSVPEEFHDITAFVGDSKGNLYVAMVGESARLVRVSPNSPNGADGKEPAPTTLFEQKDVAYIWGILPAPDGSLYMATGPHGKVYHLVDGQKPEVVLETGGKNVTALCFDKDGNLIVGTDSRGLVIRVDAKTSKPFVLFDAGKMDINALVTDHDGNIYVATAKAQLGGGDEEGAGDESDTKSKPDVPETQPADAPADVAPGDKAGALLTPVANPLEVLSASASFFCADPSDGHGLPSGIPPELKALLKKAAAQKSAHKDVGDKSGSGGPSTKSHRPSAAARMLSHGMPMDDEDSSATPPGVFRIGTDGAVTPIVQNGNDVYALLLNDDNLLIGTGGEASDSGSSASGKIFQYHLPDQSLALLSRVKEQQITTLSLDAKKQIWFGTGNASAVYRLGSGLAATGTYTSKVLDAGHSAAWGHATADLTLPQGVRVSLSTRSGNTADAEKNGKFWSEWSSPAPLTPDEAMRLARVPVTAPAGRYLQYRLTLSSDGDSTAPVVNGVTLAYQVHNLKPVIKAVSVTTGSDTSDSDDPSQTSPDRSTDASPPETVAHLMWDASDPNNDTLTYRLYYAQVVPGDSPVWTPLARGLRDTSFDWDTRALSDGRYRIMVVASDKLDNPGSDAFEVARSSAPFIVDHTPPVIGELAANVKGAVVTVKGSATDAMSTIVDVRYQVDGAGSTGPGPHSGPGGQSTSSGSSGDSDAGDWQPALPSATLFDSPQDAFTIVTRSLSAGPHRITVRATDAGGNSSYKTVTVRIGS